MEQESSEPFDASLAFLDEALDVSNTAHVPAVDPPTNCGSFSPLTRNSADLEQLLKFIDDIGDREQDVVETGDQTALRPRTRLILEDPRFKQLQTVPLTTKSTQQPEKKKKLKYDPNKARNERRFELAFLRKEVKDLEMTLQQFQSVQSKREGESGGRTDQVAVLNSRRGKVALWEGICARQFNRRLKVERENIHLKMMYSSQLQVARSLERLLKKRMTLQDVAYSETSKRTRRVEIPDGYMMDVAARSFEELTTGVEMSYREIEAVFEANGSLHADVPTREPLQRDHEKGTHMELFDSKIMPFNMKVTGEAWWRRWHNYKGQFTQATAGNTITEKFGLEMSDVKTNTTATFYVQQVLHRYVETNRIVIVWHSHIVPLDFEKKRVSGIHYREKGYVLIKPYNSEFATGSDDGCEGSARVLTCYIIIPHLSDLKERKGVKADTLTKFVISATSANISTTSEMVENLLVDQSMQT